MNGNSAYDEWAAPDQGDGPDVEPAMREQYHSRFTRRALDYGREMLQSRNNWSKPEPPTVDELVAEGMRAVFEPAPLPCLDDLTMRPRPCGCVGSEQASAACIEAASIAALNQRAGERGKAWRFDRADGRLRAHQGGMTLRWFADTGEAWQWEALQ